MVALSPTLAWASVEQTCAHPLAGASCVKAYSLVSLAYMVFATTYAAAALVILRPRWSMPLWRAALLGTPLVSYLICMAGFTLGGLAGLLRYPHDQSPFFYMDWFQVTFVLLGVTAYVAAALRAVRARDDQAPPQPASSDEAELA